ncbi:MAG: D-alanyl-D-alanine carboxypeptidase [Clostridiales bacterium]|nr:D-alanyl-D-alanine carboxypeptidase [Clostridiales bacterium]
MLIEKESRTVIFGKNENKTASMASTTKIMTSLLALESGKINQKIVVTREMLDGIQGTSIDLKAGDEISLKDLVYGMLLNSGNDAANVSAFAVSGSTSVFADLMNSRAEKIGMKNTHFVTPSGLDADTHYSTAYDMALLTAEAISNPVFCDICSTKKYTANYGVPLTPHTFSNHNRLLSSYEGAFGVKTGFTKKSGRCLVSSAEKDGVTLIAVTLKAPDDWNDHKKLLDYGFSLVRRVNIDENLCYNVGVVNSDEEKINAVEAFTPYVSSLIDISKLEKKIEIKPFEYAPIEKGEVLGQVRYLYNGKAVCRIPLVAEKSVKCNVTEIKEEKNFIKRLLKK